MDICITDSQSDLTDDRNDAESEQMSYFQASTSQVPQPTPPLASANFNQPYVCPPSVPYTANNYLPVNAPPYYGHMPSILPPSHPPSNMDSHTRPSNSQGQTSQSELLHNRNE